MHKFILSEERSLRICCAGMQKLVAGCPELGQRTEFARIGNLRSIDCIATRLWFDRRVATRFPANVLSGFEECTGGTWFNLNDLQVRDFSMPNTEGVQTECGAMYVITAGPD